MEPIYKDFSPILEFVENALLFVKPVKMMLPVHLAIGDLFPMENAKCHQFTKLNKSLLPQLRPVVPTRWF